MDKRPNIPKRKSDTPSKLLMPIALVVGVLLSYSLVKNVLHHKKTALTQIQPIVLPELIKTPELPKPEIKSETPEPVAVITPSVPVKEPLPPVVKVKAVRKDNEWQYVKPRAGDSMAAIFNRLGLNAQTLHAVMYKNPYSKALTSIKPSQRLEFLINKKQLVKLVIPVNSIQTLTVFKEGSQYKTKMISKKLNSQNLYVTATVTGSLFTTARRLNIPSKLVAQMTDILNKQIDFTRTVRAGDHFSIVYNAYYLEDRMVQTGDIQAIRYTGRGKSFEAVRYTYKDGSHEYFSPKGNSFKKAFSRYPIKYSHISSTFAISRYHPILHYKRAHKGIDLAAPIGTPILATGDGTIETIDRHNGYGNMIKIKHDKTYSTIYAHMLRFQRGLSRGSRVKRGQVIGYVGQTGLASGPHCHYEVHVNNQARNPTTIPLPSASPLSSREMAAFRANANTLLARLTLQEKASYALMSKKKRSLG